MVSATAPPRLSCSTYVECCAALFLRWLAIVFLITACVTMGFEHSIANLFFLPYALALGGFGDAQLLTGSVRNLLAVTGGNILGGTVLIAGVY